VKRHYEIGASKYKGPGYRIDNTSIDGSGLVADDGDSRHEGTLLGIETPIERAELHGYSIRTGGKVRGG
jgi:hypothetical protein